MGIIDEYLKIQGLESTIDKSVSGGGGSAGVLEPEPYKPIDLDEYLKAPSTEEMSEKQNTLLAFEKEYEAITLAIDTSYELYKDYTKQLDDLEEEMEIAPNNMDFSLNQKFNQIRDKHNTLVEKLQGDTKKQKEIYDEYTKVRTTYDKDIEIYNRWAEAENRKEVETQEALKETKDPTWGKMIYHTLRAGLNQANANFWNVFRMIEMGKIKAEDKIDDFFFPGAKDRNEKFKEKYGKDPNFSLPLDVLTDLVVDAEKNVTESAPQAESKNWLKQSMNIGLRPVPQIVMSAASGAAIPMVQPTQQLLSGGAKLTAEWLKNWLRMTPFGAGAGAGKAREIEKQYEEMGKEAPYMKMLVSGALTGLGEMATEMPVFLGVMKVINRYGAGTLINQGAKSVIGKYGKAASQVFGNIFLQGFQEGEMYLIGKSIDEAMGDPQDWSKEDIAEGVWKDFYGGLMMGFCTLGISGGISGSASIASKSKRAFDRFVKDEDDLQTTLKKILEYQGIIMEEPEIEALAYEVREEKDRKDLKEALTQITEQSKLQYTGEAYGFGKAGDVSFDFKTRSALTEIEQIIEHSPELKETVPKEIIRLTEINLGAETTAEEIDSLLKRVVEGAKVTPEGKPKVPIDHKKMAEDIAELHNKNKGSTYNLYEGNLKGQDKYAVSVHPELEKTVVGEKVSPKALELNLFIKNNMELLKKPDLSVSTWYDKETNKTHIDISKTVKTLEEAVALGQKYNQKAVINLKTGEKIDVPKVEVEAPKIEEPLPLPKGAVLEQKDLREWRQLYIDESKGIIDKDRLNKVKVAIVEWVGYLDAEIGKMDVPYNEAFVEALKEKTSKLENPKAGLVEIDTVLSYIHSEGNLLDYILKLAEKDYSKPEIIKGIQSELDAIRELANLLKNRGVQEVAPKAPIEIKDKEKVELKKVEEKVEPKEELKAIPKDIEENELIDMDNKPIKLNEDGTITLYHRTTPENAKKIKETGIFISKENLNETFFSTKKDGQSSGYGKGIITVRIKPSDVRLDDAFHGGDISVAISNKKLSKEVIVSAKALNLEEQSKESIKEINRLKGIIKTIKGNKEKRTEFKKTLMKYIKEKMPYAIRNKMLATMKNVSGDKALEKAMERVDQYTLEYYGRQYTKTITKELKAKRIKPKRTKSAMLKGRFTPVIQDKLDFIRANINGNRGEALEKIQSNNDAFNQGKAIHIAEENELLNMVGIKEMDLETLQSTLANIKNLKKTGRTLKGEEDEANRKRHEEDIIKVLRVFGKEVTIDEETGKGKIDSSYKTLPKTKEMKWLKKTFDKIVNWQFGWDNLLDKLSALDKTSKPYESDLSKIGDKVHYARSTNIGSLEDVLDMIQIKFAESFEATSRKDITKICQKLREEVDLGEFENSEGDLVHLVLTKEQILKKVMQLDDPSLEPTFNDGMLYTDEIKDALRGAVSKKEQAYVDGVREIYDYMWKRINPTFEDMYGIHFPYNPFYSGTIRRDVDLDIPEATLLSQDSMRFVSILNPSLKTRSKTKQSLQYDDMTSSLMNYVMQMEHFIAWAKPLQDLRSVFGDKRVKSVINEVYGQDVLTKINGFLDDMTRDGVDKGKIIKSVDTIRFNFTRSILAKPHIALKQIPSVLAYMTEMPVDDFIKGVGNFWKNPIKNYRYLVAHSAYARARFGEGFERDIHGAMQSDYVHLLSHTHKFSDMFMGMVRAGDKFAIMQGMWAKFYSETQGQTTKAKNTEEAIKRAEIVTQRTQPSFTTESLATGQRGGSLLKLFTMFQNQPNKYFRIIADNARNFKYGRGSRVKAASNIVLAWAILPMIFQFIGDGGKWIKAHQLRALILGAVNDILVFGSMIRGMYGWLIEESYDVEASPVFATMREIEYCLAKVAKYVDPDKDITPEDIQAFTEHFAKAAGQLVGLPTPYGVQVKKAIESGDYRQFLFSEYILNLGEEKKKKKKPYVKSYGKKKYSKYLKSGYSKKSKYGKYLKKY